MRVVILTDTHWGARSDSRVFLDYFARFHAEVFFPYLNKHGIDTVCHLGDLVDRRKYIAHTTANRMRTVFLDQLGDKHLIIIPGNHDCPYRDSLDANAVRELTAGRDNVDVVEEPRFVGGGFPGHAGTRGVILMLPWICPANEVMAKEAVTKARNNVRIIMGHLELAGFQVQRGRVMEKGMDASAFAGFPLVLSGHYHHRNSIGDIHYLGSPYEITWADHDDPKGFHVLDLDTHELEFIPNPLRMHERLEFDDREDMDISFSDYHDKIVKVIVRHRDATAGFDAFMRKLEEANPASVQVMDDNLVKAVGDDQPIGDLKDTLDILMSHVGGVGDSVDKDRLRELLGNLYQEATQIEC
jgi:Straboviridae/Ackermannviridae/Kyanoviridae exonuclease subunit 1